MREHSERYYWLDAVRGVAALIVVFSHLAAYGIYKNEPYWSYAQIPPFGLLWSGHQAVIVFFVLSGFALYMLCETASLSPSRFIWVRVLRIYPPYLAAVLLAVVGLKLPFWLGVQWPAKNPGIPLGTFTLSDVIDHVVMIGHFAPKRIDPPIWSLVYEMRLSLLFPLIYLAVSRFSYRLLIFPVLFTAGFAAMISSPRIYNTLANHPAWIDTLRTLHFAGMFFVGASMAKYRVQVSAFANFMSGPSKWLVGIISALIYLYSYGFTRPLWGNYVGELATAAAAAGFIMLALSAMSRPPAVLTKLGAISFSLYLTHHIVIQDVALFGYGVVPNLVIWIVSLAIAFLLAYLFYRYVERPSHRASRNAVRQSSQLRLQEYSRAGVDGLQETSTSS